MKLMGIFIVYSTSISCTYLYLCSHIVMRVGSDISVPVRYFLGVLVVRFH
jgi:hypothetical protein